MHNLECPGCKYKFIIEEDYKNEDCPKCLLYRYYWDYVLDDETYEEMFAGYYWEEKNKL